MALCPGGFVSVAANVRSTLLHRAAGITGLYDEMVTVYRGWLDDSLQPGAALGERFERRIERHLMQSRSRIVGTVRAAVTDASESARALADSDFSPGATDDARRDLEALAVDELQRRVVAQLQWDQGSLIQQRMQARMQAVASPELTDLLEQKELYRPDALGRQRRSQEYVALAAQHSLFSLCNTLTYALLLQQGDSHCTLGHALNEPEQIAVEDFLGIQEKRMHPRSTLLIYKLTDKYVY